MYWLCIGYVLVVFWLCFECCSGGNRFSIVEEAYFQRAASIHPLNADANLSYGVVLFEIRKDPTTALLYLRQALQLQTELYEACLVALKEERLVLNSAPSPSRRKELNMKEMINRYNYDRVCNVVRRTEQQVQGLSGKWAPVQALWRGHWDRCKLGWLGLGWLVYNTVFFES